MMRRKKENSESKNSNNNKRNGHRRRILFLAGTVLITSVFAGCGMPGLSEAEETVRGWLSNVQSTSEETTAASADSGDDFFLTNPLEDLGKTFEDVLPKGDSLFRNKAVSYYYRSVLNAEEQSIYDALLAVVQDPTSTTYRKHVIVTTDPDSDAFTTEISRAYEAMIFDHPELFWFRQSSGNFHYSYNTALSVGGRYMVTVQLSAPYENYQAEMTAFNQAVDAFMADIDLAQSQPMIALQIHDKLIGMVSYDHDLAAQYSEGGTYDYGYSAYGALVANSRGQANTAVCDGYSYAYEYLCQQAGLTVTRVGGYAGEDTSSMEGHSWNLLNFDGQWYEVDPTWDDREVSFDANDPSSAIFAEAQADTAFWNRITHFMFDLTTAEISDFTPDDRYTYYAADGSYATFLGHSVHVRDDGTDPEETGDYLSCLAPEATGTTYTYENLVAAEDSTAADGSDSDAGSDGSSDASGGDSGDASGSQQQDPLLQVDADGDGVPDDSGYVDADQDGYVDNWQNYVR